jgi:hypothetical protein
MTVVSLGTVRGGEGVGWGEFRVHKAIQPCAMRCLAQQAVAVDLDVSTFFIPFTEPPLAP